MFSIYDGRSEFYQWDIDRKLIVNDETVKQVHFCNKTDDCSLVCEVYDLDGVRVVDVPNILLQTDWRINVYGYDVNYTKYSACFKVNTRSKPENYVYTDEEVKCFEESIEKATNALAAAKAAEAKADEAYANAKEAKTETAKISRSLGDLYIGEKQDKTVVINDMCGTVKEVVSIIDGIPKQGNPNLLTDGNELIANWPYDEVIGFWKYRMSLPAGTYTIFYNAYDYVSIHINEIAREIYAREAYTFTTTQDGELYLSCSYEEGEVKLEVGEKHTENIIFPNLIPVDLSDENNWFFHSEVDLYRYSLPSPLPAGTYTIYIDGQIEEPMYVEIGAVYPLEVFAKEPCTFTLDTAYNVKIDNWNYKVCPIKIERGTEFTGWAESNPNLIPLEYASGSEMWPMYNEDENCAVLTLEDVPAGTYTLYQENDWWDGLSFITEDGEVHYADCGTPYTFEHVGGSINFYDYSWGVYYSIVKLEEGSEYTGNKGYTYDTEFNKVELTVNDTVYTTELSGPVVYGYYDWIKGQLHYDETVEFYEPQEIEVKNNSTLSSNTGETRIVYGRDLTSVIEELQYAILSLGGNV